MQFRDDLYTNVGKSFNGMNLKNMLMIKDIVNSEGMDRESVSSRRVQIDDFPLFTKQDLPEVLWAYMISCLTDGSDPSVEIHNLLDTLLDSTLKSKRKSKKDGEGYSNPPLSLAKKPKKFETSRRILRSADTEDSKVHKWVATEAARATEAVRAAKAAEVASIAKSFRASKDAEVANVVKITEESSHLTKEAKKGSIEASTHQNPFRSSNAKYSNISDSIIIDTSSILDLITTITNPSNVSQTTNTLEIIEPKNTIV